MSPRETFEFVLNDGSKIPAKRWINRDGSVGGWVAENAVVHPTAVIDELAIVGPLSVVTAGSHVVGEIPVRSNPRPHP